MSLLNDALRKKNKEADQFASKGYPYHNEPPGRQRHHIKTYTFPILFALACACIGLMVWDMLFPVGSLPSRAATAAGRGMADIPVPVTGERNEQKMGDVQLSTVERQALSEGGAKGSVSKKLTDVPVIPVSPREDGAHKIKVPKAPQNAREKPEAMENPISQKPEDAFFKKALAYHQRENFPRAIQMYQEVLRKNPNHYDACFNLAAVYLTQHEFDQAYPILFRLHDSHAENPEILLNLAIAEMGRGRPQQAIIHLDAAASMKVNPEFEICYHKAIAYNRLKDFKKAEAWYIKAKKIRPAHPPLLFNMALLYDKQNQYDRALKYYEMFLKYRDKTSVSEQKKIRSRIKAIQIYRVRLS